MVRTERDYDALDYSAYLTAYEHAWQRAQDDPSPQSLAILHADEARLYQELFKPGKFPLGHVVATPGSLDLMERDQHIPSEFLLRHVNGDWGDLCAEDIQENERALVDGSRLFSSYSTRGDARLWIITEWDRSATTLLLPEDY